MYQLIRKIACLAICLSLIFSCSPQNSKSNSNKYDRIVTKYTKIDQIVSSEVNDTFYIFIRLPKSYSSSNKSYPVLYLLDGDISFNMAVSTIRYLQFGKDIPEMIIVAPAYGTVLSDDEQNFRERDYTPTRIERFENSGTAEKYLNFINNELIPHIDSSYRTNEDRTLNGYSLGGLFTIYAMLSERTQFKNFIAGSPYLTNDIDKIEKVWSDNLSKLSDVKIFISVGELEDKSLYHKPINKLVDLLKEYKGIEVKFTNFKNGTHFTCPAEALVYGLKFIYE